MCPGGFLDSSGDVKGGNLSFAALGGTKALAGAMAGIATQTATYPGNTMIKRMQSNGAGGRPKLYSSTPDCIRQILAKEGVGGFYRGKKTRRPPVAFVSFERSSVSDRSNTRGFAKPCSGQTEGN